MLNTMSTINSRKYVMRCCLVIILFLSSLQFANAQTKDEQAVQHVFNKKFDWLKNKQSDSLKIILDDRLMYVHSNGWVQSKQEVIDDLHNGKLSYTNFDIGEIKVRVYSNSAIVTGNGKFSGVMSENPFAVDLMFTEVYVLKNKNWMLVSRHANRMP